MHRRRRQNKVSKVVERAMIYVEGEREGEEREGKRRKRRREKG